MKKINISRGQNLIEYSVFIFCLVAALISMQVYIKRAIQGRVRQSVDDVGEQFDPRRTSMNVNYNVKGLTITRVVISRDINNDGTDDDVNGDGVIDNKDYFTRTMTGVGVDPDDPTLVILPETTQRSGFEDVGEFGGLYD